MSLSTAPIPTKPASPLHEPWQVFGLLAPSNPDNLLLEHILQRVVANKITHAKFCNTLSMMEHIGSRKIMATHSHGLQPDKDVLQHLAEEARHAFFFKRQAEKLAEKSLGWENDELLAASAARLYFARLDATVNRLVQKNRSQHITRTCYLLVTGLVEVRAVWAYQQYTPSEFSLAGLLQEEEGHLTDVARELLPLDPDYQLMQQAYTAETLLYRKLAASLSKALS
ncbi:MAG: hypothetical protein ACOYK8_04865 [Alphaproteobacteria bacterium]